MAKISPEQIDDLLPQTQCGLCGHGGCMPYAEAMVFENANINLCPPGGVSALEALGNLLNKDITPYLAEMEAKAKPPLVARIREAECIGCTKCIQACPVDAIIGSAKNMHAVINAECTGCELCVPPCPVDCIDMLNLTNEAATEDKKKKADHARKRFHARNQRLTREKKCTPQKSAIDNKKSYIQAAIARAKEKKNKM
ncbi:MAG: RnfABCDGE type electron transport complex subunit B [Gammaproteobacteria bacterium]|nr:RnfABCDGE type electron transport complex subunit B [Gammaproteobacteria bacterium]